MVYVLTVLMSDGGTREWRPVAVIDDNTIANQWADRSPDNDWIGFEMNDLSMIGLTDRTFEPKPSVPAEEKAEKAEMTSRELVQINHQLLGVIEALAKKHKDKVFLDLIKKLKAEGKIASEVKTAKQVSAKQVLIPVEGTNASVDILKAWDDDNLDIVGSPMYLFRDGKEYYGEFQGCSTLSNGEVFITISSATGGTRAPAEGAYFTAGCITHLRKQWTVIGPSIMPLKEEPDRQVDLPYEKIPGLKTVNTKTAAVPYNELKPGVQVWFDTNPEAKGTVLEVRKKNKDDPQNSYATVDWGKFGIHDVPIRRLSFGQKSLFAGNKRWKSFKNYEPHIKDEILRLRHTPDCKLPVTGKCTCKPCPECGAKNEVWGYGALDERHKPDCSAMFPPQQTLF